MDYSETSVSLIKEGRWNELTGVLQEWSQSDPRDPVPMVILYIAGLLANPPHFILVESLIEKVRKRKSYRAAKKWAKSLSETQADGNVYLQLMVAGIEGLSDVNKSIEMLDALTANHPDIPEPWFVLGVSWYGAEVSEQYLTKATELRPDFIAAHYFLGRVRVERGKVELAKSNQRKAITLAPDCPHINFELGMIFFNEGKKADARPYLEKVVELAPDEEVGRQARATLSAGVALKWLSRLTGK